MGLTDEGAKAAGKVAKVLKDKPNGKKAVDQTAGLILRVISVIADTLL